MINNSHLVWIDLEMTGLSPETDSILEIASVITDEQLNLIAEGPVYAIQHASTQLECMDEWNRNQHGKSGLWQRVLESTITMQSAEHNTLEFLSRYVTTGKSPICGNSICQDRRFLARLMPQLESFFHYRNLDVSTIKELCRRWAPTHAKGLVKKSMHTALSDIHESIEELRYYRQFMGELGGLNNP